MKGNEFEWRSLADRTLKGERTRASNTGQRPRLLSKDE
jgi:hypothetical protein